MFTIKQGLAAPEFQRQGGEWEPDAHFTGDAENRDEIAAVQNVIDKHAGGIVAFYVYNPFPRMYSIELQFKTGEQGAACRKDYSKLFTSSGKLKRTVK